MSIANIPGSKWWKFDFHTHTPKSDDYPDKSLTAEQWLLTHMKTDMDAVIVTDHNSGEWVDTLKAGVNELRKNKHADFRELVIFPGVELAVSGGTHVLLVLEPSKGGSDVGGIIRTCGYTGSWGQPAGRASMSLDQVLDVAQQQKALVIPAHVDRPNGLWEMPDFGSQTNALNHRDLFALERISKTSTLPTAAANLKKTFAEVLGSDSHKMSEVGRGFTWVKMGQPTLEGLRLALLDGDQSLRRSDEHTGNPNDGQSSQIIEHFEVTKAQFVGRPTTFSVEFNPWMNTLIGGRGTGKSSLLEFIRITLSREDELDGFPDLRTEFDKKYKAVWAGREAGGLQTAETEFRLVYQKDGQRYRINYNRNNSLPRIEESDGANGWKLSVGDVVSRFPVRIYSQKQIYELADNPSALLEIIDQDATVVKKAWDTQWATECNSYRAVMVKIRELRIAVGAEGRLRGELDDVNRKLKVLENFGNQAILQTFQRTQSQSGYVEEWGQDVAGIPESIRGYTQGINLPEFDPSQFDATIDADVLAAAKAASDSVAKLATDLEAVAKKADAAAQAWSDFQNSSDWKKRVLIAKTAYDGVVQQLQAQGVEDPSEFKQRIKQRQQLELQLKDIDAKKAELTKLEKQRNDALEQMLKLRQKLSDDRASFLRNVLKGATHVQIDVVRFGDTESAVSGYRRIIRRDDGLDDDILDLRSKSGILLPLYAVNGKPVADFLTQFEKLKGRTRNVVAGSEADGQGLGGWFVKHLTTKVKAEDLDELDIWFPEDSLEMKYRPREGENFRPISQGSPGQKTAALLAFLLSYGTEPILLDQPEDDLDNQLIFNLVTQQLIANKSRRQVIVVTHNANIVVNGDAELVLALESKGGQTVYQAKGGLQDAKVRQTICDVMEGGGIAFELRYRRIKEGLEPSARNAGASGASSIP